MAEKLIKPGTRSQELGELRQRYVARGPYNITPLFISRAKGAVVWDVDGQRLLDFAGGIGVQNVGHCAEEVVEAIKEQVENFIHPCFHVIQYESYVRLAEQLAQVVPIPGAKKVMLVNSGAEAVENAVKIARKATGRTGIISCECGFHGRTLLAMSLTSKVKPYKYGFGPFAPDTYKIPYAYCYRCPYGRTYPDCDLYCAEQLERLFVSEVAPENIAALIIEPVQGEGGFIVPPPGYLARIQGICRKYGIMVIADEIQTGFARTGKLFATENFPGFEPDLMTLSKSLAAGVPLSAVVGRAEVMDAPGPGEIGGTFAGSPLGCVAALKVLEICKRENLSDRAMVMGTKMFSRFRKLAEECQLIGDVRGLGAMVGLELVKNRQSKEPAKEETARAVAALWQRGLIGLSAGIYGNVLRFLPPLSITDEQLDDGLEIIATVLKEINALSH